MRTTLAGMAALPLLTLAATAQTDTDGISADRPSASATFIDASGAEIGTARLIETPHGVLIEAELTGLPPGEHGFHIHETGICDPADGFASAGGHYAPRGHDHGFEAAEGFHAGDMPNQFVAADGTLMLHVLNQHVTLREGEGSLLDGDGSALMIHGGADDYASQPSGDAGARIACAVIEAD